MRSTSKKVTATLLGLMLAAFLTQSAFAEDNVNWKVFSKNLVKGLQSENTGIQMSSMQLVIEHGDKVDVKDALLEIWHIFRTHNNPKVRQLALTTLTKMKSNLAMEYVKRQVEFENDPAVKKQIQHIVSATK